jgi:hypothetical protein
LLLAHAAMLKLNAITQRMAALRRW